MNINIVKKAWRIGKSAAGLSHCFPVTQIRFGNTGTRPTGQTTSLPSLPEIMGDTQSLCLPYITRSRYLHLSHIKHNECQSDNYTQVHTLMGSSAGKVFKPSVSH